MSCMLGSTTHKAARFTTESHNPKGRATSTCRSKIKSHCLVTYICWAVFTVVAGSVLKATLLGISITCCHSRALSYDESSAAGTDHPFRDEVRGTNACQLLLCYIKNSTSTFYSILYISQLWTQASASHLILRKEGSMENASSRFPCFAQSMGHSLPPQDRKEGVSLISLRGMKSRKGSNRWKTNLFWGRCLSARQRLAASQSRYISALLSVYHSCRMNRISPSLLLQRTIWRGLLGTFHWSMRYVWDPYSQGGWVLSWQRHSDKDIHEPVCAILCSSRVNFINTLNNRYSGYNCVPPWSAGPRAYRLFRIGEYVHVPPPVGLHVLP